VSLGIFLSPLPLSFFRVSTTNRIPKRFLVLNGCVERFPLWLALRADPFFSPPDHLLPSLPGFMSGDCKSPAFELAFSSSTNSLGSPSQESHLSLILLFPEPQRILPWFQDRAGQLCSYNCHLLFHLLTPFFPSIDGPPPQRLKQFLVPTRLTPILIRLTPLDHSTLPPQPVFFSFLLTFPVQCGENF